MVMKIESGKTYRTRDGRKASVYEIKKLLYSNEHLAYYTTEEGHNEVVYASNGRGNDIEGNDHPVDLIAEWQDEPKKEISDMSEVKFKVGDWITRSGWPSEGYQVTKIDKEADQVWLSDNYAMPTSYPYIISPTKWEIVKTATNVPEIGTKWVFNDGQDFIVRVVGFNDKGKIVLESLSIGCGFKKSVYFTFENEPEKFGEFYKPWVEKPKSVTGYARIERDLRTGEILVWAEGHSTEEGARNHFDSGEGSYELLDVVKVEWSEG